MKHYDPYEIDLEFRKYGEVLENIKNLSNNEKTAICETMSIFSSNLIRQTYRTNFELVKIQNNIMELLINRKTLFWQKNYSEQIKNINFEIFDDILNCIDEPTHHIKYTEIIKEYEALPSLTEINDEHIDNIKKTIDETSFYVLQNTIRATNFNAEHISKITRSIIKNIRENSSIIHAPKHIILNSHYVASKLYDNNELKEYILMLHAEHSMRIGKHCLRFDILGFIIGKNNIPLMFAIEIDEKDHFNEKNDHRYDIYKDAYCFLTGISLLRIKGENKNGKNSVNINEIYDWLTTLHLFH